MRGRNPNLYSDADIDDLINTYQKTIATVSPAAFLEKLITDYSATVSVAGEINLPSDFNRIAGSILVNGNTDYRLISAEEVISALKNQHISGDNLAYVQSNKIMFSPSVNVNDTVRFFYIRQPADLVNDTDQSELAEEIIPLLIYRTAVDIAISMGLTEFYTMLTNQFNNELTLLTTMSTQDLVEWIKNV